MKKKHLVVGSLGLINIGLVYAGAPLWTFIPLTPTAITVPVNGTATIQYLVTNQSRQTHTLAVQPIPGLTQNTAPGYCSTPFVLGYQQSCTLTLTVNGSFLAGNVVGGPQVCEQGNPLQCYQPSPANVLNIIFQPNAGEAILSSSVTNLSLAANGIDRLITVTNTSNNIAFGVHYSTSPNLPAGSTISPANCGNLAPFQSCVLTVHPGSVASATPGDLNPSPISLTILGDNTNTLIPALNILTYGSVYQSGYVFAIDDSLPNTGSISGKVVSLIDQAPPFPNGIIWASNGNGSTSADVANNPIPGINQDSNTPLDACNGKTDGACNTRVITNFYAGVNPNFYAAGLCLGAHNGYADWYLPAVCEMGYKAGIADAGCGTQAAPLIQNIQSNLVDNGNIGNIGSTSGNENFYWSSTQYSVLPATNAWGQGFQIPGFLLDPVQSFFTKDQLLGVRCARVLTQ